MIGQRSANGIFDAVSPRSLPKPRAHRAVPILAALLTTAADSDE